MEATGSGRVVVGVSATHAGFQAVRYAVAEARRRRQPLIAVRTYRPGATSANAALRLTLTDTVIEDVARIIIEALGGLPIDVEMTAVVQEIPGEAICKVADRTADLIVIGGSGAPRLFGRRQAAVARTCSRAAVCPVVIVPPPAMARTARETRLARDAALGIEAFLESQPTAHPAGPATR